MVGVEIRFETNLEQPDTANFCPGSMLFPYYRLHLLQLLQSVYPSTQCQHRLRCKQKTLLKSDAVFLIAC